MPGPNFHDIGRVQKEESQQIAVFMWASQRKIRELRPQLDYMNGDMAGMSASSKIAAAKAKAAGNKKGFPDIFLPYPVRIGNDHVNKYHGLFIELKLEKYRNRKNGGCSEDQLEYHRYLAEVGYVVVVCYGYMEAILEICKYLSLNPEECL